MEFDASWCTVCAKLIAPKRYRVPIEQPSLPQALPSFKGKKYKANTTHCKPGLVAGTGRLSGTMKAPQPRYRTVIDQSPQGLYCSDTCRVADTSSIYLGLPLYLERNISRVQFAISPPPPTPSPSSSSVGEESTTSSASKLDPTHARESTRQLGSPPLPHLNTMNHPNSADEDCCSAPNEDTGGIAIANKSTGVTPDPWKMSVPLEAVHNAHCTGACRPSFIADPTENLYTQFSEALTRRAESRLSPGYRTASRSPSFSSGTSTSVLKQDRSILMPGAEGKLLVPNVKLKVRSSSRALHYSVGRSLCCSCSPCSALRTFSNEDVAPRSPLVEAHSWSYSDVLTYPVMQHPKNIVKRIERQIVDGRKVEVEVEVELPPKKLFLFAPSIRPTNQRYP
ncbi:hypothetical protein H1R20_g6573, partial [Candolleomyces eurysporus]